GAGGPRGPRPGPPGRGAARDDGRRGVPEDERPPRAEEVEVGTAVHVPQARPLGARDEERLAADAAEGADRAVDAAGDHARGSLEEALGVAHHELRPRRAPIPSRSQTRPAANESRSAQRHRSESSATCTKSRFDALQRNAATASARPATTDVTR